MYSIDLQKISLDEFSGILKSADLLPGRRILLNDLDRVIERFKQQGINNLSELQTLLKKKRVYAALTKTIQVSEDYLVVLNREVNSYISKSPDLTKLDLFTVSELESLNEQQISNTKDLYRKLQSKASRQTMSEKTKISMEKLEAALQKADLIRINGVGPVFAGLLQEMGIHSAHDLLATPAQKTLESYQHLNKSHEPVSAKPGVEGYRILPAFCRVTGSGY